MLVDTTVARREAREFLTSLCPNGFRRKLVYLSGPITCSNYDRTKALTAALTAHRDVMRAGYGVLNPMLTAFLPCAFDESFTHDDWLAGDLPIVAAVDAVFRLPGPSKGADQECDMAKELGIPVVHNLMELQEVFGGPVHD